MVVKRSRRTAWGACLALAGLLVAALAGSAGAAGLAKGAASLTIGVSPDPAYAPYIVGVQKGFFQKYGLNPSLSYFSNGGEMNDAVVAGQVQFSASGTGTLLPRLSTRKEAIIAVTATSGTTFAMAARKSLKTPADFVGKKLGVVPGTTPEFVWQAFLKKYKIQPSQVQIVYASPPELTASLAQGRIDAMYIWQPWPLKATQLSNDVGIFQHSRDVGYLLYFAAAGNVDYMKSHPNETTAILKGLRDSIAYINANKDEAVAIMADVMHLSKADTAPLVADYDQKLEMPSRGMILDAHATGAWLASKHKLNTRIMPWKDAFDTSYLAKLLHVKPVSAVLTKKSGKK